MGTLECGVDALSINFTAHLLTESKDKGNLRYVKWNVLKLLSVVEKSVLDTCKSGDIFYDGSFIDLLHMICLEKVPQVGCDDHKELVMGSLMYDYLVTRFKCVARHTKRERVETKKGLFPYQKKVNQSVENISHVTRSSFMSFSF